MKRAEPVAVLLAPPQWPGPRVQLSSRGVPVRADFCAVWPPPRLCCPLATGPGMKATGQESADWSSGPGSAADHLGTMTRFWVRTNKRRGLHSAWDTEGAPKCHPSSHRKRLQGPDECVQTRVSQSSSPAGLKLPALPRGAPPGPHGLCLRRGPEHPHQPPCYFKLFVYSFNVFYFIFQRQRV